MAIDAVSSCLGGPLYGVTHSYAAFLRPITSVKKDVPLTAVENWQFLILPKDTKNETAFYQFLTLECLLFRSLETIGISGDSNVGFVRS